MPAKAIKKFAISFGGMLFIAAALYNHALETPFLIDFSVFDRYLEQSTPAPTTRETSLAWQQMLQDAASLPVEQQLETVNTFLHNTLSYELDASLYQVEDYWASPAEILSSRRGDCEDWAITSYISLRALGIPDAQLRLVYVRARIGAEHSGLSLAHMVLAYYPDADAEPLILDSLIQNILPASARPDLTPVFSFNATGLWAGSGNQKSKHSASARLSRWRDLVERLTMQGIFL